MNDSVLIKHVVVLNPASPQEQIADVRLSGGRITHMGKLDAQPGDMQVNGSGLWLSPGLIDMHTHLRDLGQKDKEDIGTATAAAAAGGFTTVVAMANTDPPLDNAGVFKAYLERIQEKARVEVLPCAAVTVGLKGNDLTSMDELAELGAVAFSDDGMTISNLLVLRRALTYAQASGRIIISHAEDRDLSGGGALQESKLATTLGLGGIPQASETAAVAREIEVVKEVGCAYHFTHLSCAGSVELVRRAKLDGLSITCDVTPHHIALTVEDIPGYDSNYKMKPPLRTAPDRHSLIDGLLDGTIDAIATDHAPHTRLDKITTFSEAAVGITGLETAFPLCLETLVINGRMKPIDLIKKFTTGPAAILGLPAPCLDVDSGDLTLFDPQLKWTFNAASGFSRGHNSPFNGRQMTGKPILTICGGKVVYRDDAHLLSRSLTEQTSHNPG